MNIGIYAIRNIINGKRYVGSTGKLNERWGQHRADLNKGTHFNSYLQNAWKKYSASAFVYDIVERCSTKEGLLEREEYWIKELKSHCSQYGYNFCKKPRASRLGCKASPETIAKMKISLGGKNHPNWGRKLSKQHVKHMADAQRGISKPTSGKTKSYMILSPEKKVLEVNGLRKFCRNLGIPHAPMWRLLVGKQKEYNGWKSLTYVQKPKQRQVGFWKGKKLSEETKRKMSESGKGKNRGPISEKRRQLIIEGIRRKKQCA